MNRNISRIAYLFLSVLISYSGFGADAHQELSVVQRLKNLQAFEQKMSSALDTIEIIVYGPPRSNMSVAARLEALEAQLEIVSEGTISERVDRLAEATLKLCGK